MPKTTFNTYKSSGESPLDSFQDQPKDYGVPKSDLEKGLNDFFQQFSQVIKPDVNDGALSSAGIYVPTGQLSLRAGRLTGKEYQQKFEPVELPPRAIDVMAEDPDSASEAKTFYQDYLSLYEERKANMLAALGSGKYGATDTEIIKQMLSKLDDAIEFTKEQLKGLTI